MNTICSYLKQPVMVEKTCCNTYKYKDEYNLSMNNAQCIDLLISSNAPIHQSIVKHHYTEYHISEHLVLSQEL